MLWSTWLNDLTQAVALVFRFIAANNKFQTDDTEFSRQSQRFSRKIEKRNPRGFDPGGLKLTGDLRDENTGHLERKATGRRDRLGTRLIHIASDHALPKKNVKRLFKKRRWNMRKNSFTLFLVFVFVFCGHDLHFCILFQFCGLILFFCWACSLLGMLISVWGFVFLFSGYRKNTRT